MGDRSSTAAGEPKAIAAPTAPYRPGRASRALQWAVTTYLVIGSMVVTGYQTWRIHEFLLGEATIVGGVAITAFYALTPTVLVGLLASRWSGRGTDWVGVALLTVLAGVYMSANTQWFAARDVARPWVGGLVFVFFAAVGPWVGTLRERYRRAVTAPSSTSPEPG